MKIRHNLRLLMAKNKVKSLRELSENTSINYFVLQRFHSYRARNIDPVLITNLCEYFGCPLKDLIYLYEGDDGSNDGFPKK